MTERKPIRASERAREIVSSTLSEEEQRRRGLLLPELKLRNDAPAIEIDEATPVIQALARLDSEATGALTISESHGRPRAVVLSVDRYLQLASQEINSSSRAATADSRLMPMESAFERAHVEQVDQSENWGT